MYGNNQQASNAESPIYDNLGKSINDNDQHFANALTLIYVQFGNTIFVKSLWE